jgi:hypothetical protein
MTMPLPRPRETLESSNNTPPFGWAVGLVVLFAPSVATVAWFLRIARAGGGSADDIVTLDLLRIAGWISVAAFYLAVLQEAPRLGRARGHQFRLIHANPKLLFGLWIVHTALSWFALGLLRGMIDVDLNIEPAWLEHGAGAFLIALALLIAAWGWGRYRRAS